MNTINHADLAKHVKEGEKQSFFIQMPNKTAILGGRKYPLPLSKCNFSYGKKCEKYVTLNFKNCQGLTLFTDIDWRVRTGKRVILTNCLCYYIQREFSNALSCHGNHKSSICFAR